MDPLRFRFIAWSVTLAFASLLDMAQAATNSAPQIWGTPKTEVTVDSWYYSRPGASDANGDKLHFSIQNKPAWAHFNQATGSLQAKPSTPGTWSNIVISVSDGKSKVSLPPFSIKVSPKNTAPVISGRPAASVTVAQAYSFQPTASDANRDALGFSIRNKPTWATFSASTGRLSGTPGAADVGSYANIVISVSDGKNTVSLPAFGIAVNQVSFGSATLSWAPPTSNTDGSTLTNLAGYRIIYGTSASALTRSVQIANPSVSTYVVEGLEPATYYFAVRAYTTSGAESVNSNVASRTIH
ncbi:MAG TPA: putative Ig domain-containing protein [Povalibacter sp.]|nr:putative Ig domain-containing protein [Povalibacter sp.]